MGEGVEWSGVEGRGRTGAGCGAVSPRPQIRAGRYF